MDALTVIERLIAANVPAEHAVTAARIFIELGEGLHRGLTADLQEAVAGIASRNGVTVSEIMGRGRQHSVVVARQEAFAVVRAAGLSLPEVARAFERDHTTIMSGIRAHNERKGEVPQVAV